ncbi:hypothetical protein SAMN04489812_0266 [Microlunatus soli]|uniref:DUF222 domain-containing protein n=2 Tax=Microlunatus soli TaxID=630515 RepID=A0A1H1MUT8_9ACTN|nr:hypothetical protein SAMN04489812_0266 [Microlunatus soli]
MIDGSGLMNTALGAAGVDPSCLATDQLLHQVTAFHWLARATSNSNLRLAAAWADRFPADSITAYQLAIPGGDRPIRPGGDGTPEFTRFCVTGLAATMHKSTGTAERIIADALDLRHRLPHLWQRLCNNEVDALDCQTIARQSRHLTLEQALEVDRSIAPMVGRWSWNKLLAQLDATIIRVDAENVKKLADQAAHDVGVFMNQSNEHGIKGIYILTKTPAGIRFYAQVSRIADILARRGHPGSKNERMAAAIDVLANPLDAVRMIAEDTAPTLFDPDPDDDSLFPKATSHDADTETTDPTASEPAAPTHDANAEQDQPDDEPAPDPQDGGGQSNRFPRVDQHRHLAELAIAAIGQIDPAKFRPDATLYVHIAQETLRAGLGVTRVEDIGPMISSLVADWLGHCNITLKPVIDLNVDMTPCDAYEVPRAMRERMFLKYPTSRFPFSGADGRHLDLDHTIPYTPGRPAQTREDNLCPDGRREHNVITHGHWRRRQPEPGTFLFRAPRDGRVFLVDQTGSHDFGCGQFAQHIWHAAAPTTRT